MKKIILASGSPRRKKLLKQIGLKFEIVVSRVDETLNPKLKPKNQAAYLSNKKAQAVASKFKNSIVIAADSLVICDNVVYGKPNNKKEAVRMLKNLSGKKQTIITGFTVIDTDSKKAITKSSETKVWFRKLSITEIEKYIEKEKPYDKAGAYAIQDRGAIFVKKIEGDFFGGVGMPLYLLTKELRKFGVEVL